MRHIPKLHKAGRFGEIAANPMYWMTPSASLPRILLLLRLNFQEVCSWIRAKKLPIGWRTGPELTGLLTGEGPLIG